MKRLYMFVGLSLALCLAAYAAPREIVVEIPAAKATGTIDVPDATADLTEIIKRIEALESAVKSIDATPVSRATVEQTTIGAIRKQ